MTNFYSRVSNCLYLQRVKPVTFIYISLTKQYHALNTVFRLFHGHAEISNINPVKSTTMVKSFRLLRKSSLMIKVSKFSIKSEAAIHMYTIPYYGKAVLKSFKNVTEKKPLHEPFFK